MSNYNKAIGSSVGGSFAILLTAFVPWEQFGVPPDDIPEVVGAIVALGGALATYFAPANRPFA